MGNTALSAMSRLDAMVQLPVVMGNRPSGPVARNRVDRDQAIRQAAPWFQGIIAKRPVSPHLAETPA